MIRTTLKSLFFLLCFVVTSMSAAQEICNNGIDDDLNGFVDCYDRACADQNPCDGFFISEDPSCEAEPTAFPTFSLRLAYSSPNRTSTGNGLSTVGDLDGDGIPDIVTTNRNDNTVTVINSLDGSIKFQRNIGVSPYFEVMHADVDADGLAEIFVPTRSRSIVALSHDLSTILWTANTVYNPGNIGVADFNGDGFPEVYARDELFDAVTGNKLRNSDFNANTGNANFIERHITNGGTAVDILADSECADCDGLEYVLGGRIYSVSIDRATFTATMNLERSIDYFPLFIGAWSQNRTGTSVADYNLDGFLDVITTGRTSADPLGFTRLFFWDVQNNVIQTYNDPAYNWDKGTGRVNIADVDGDGQLNATYVTGRYLYCLDENWQQLWRTGIIEQSSGTTGTTVFDFNGDGQFETVYRDEQFLYIVNGNDGSFYTSVPCASLTYTEYPIVADVDADGATEICVSCMTNNNGNIYNDNDDAHIRIFESNGEQWVPARRIWNQHGYFNVNVNDDGTIPREQQLHHLVFSSGVCDAGDVRPLNTFLNQSPFLTSDGCSNYSAPDLNFAGNIQLDPPFCPNTDFTIGFDVSNDGDRAISTLVPVTFYDGDPRLAGSVRLNTVQVLMVIQPGETITVSDLTVQGPGNDFTLFISINDEGSQNPPISYPASPIIECDFDNNIGTIPVGSVPFPLNVTKLSDNNKCDPSLPDNGSATASTTGSVDIYFEDFESRAENAQSGGPPNGWTRTIANNTDWAEVRTENGNKEFQTRDTDGEVVFSTEIVDISTFSNINLSVLLRSENRNGDVFETADYIRAFYRIDGGAEVAFDNGDFTGAVGPTIGGTGSDSETATATGLTGSTVQIVIRMNNTANNEYYFVDDVSMVATGQITAGISFNWFFGPTAVGAPDFVGATNTGMQEGVWTVFARNDTYGCNSDTVQVTINATSDNPTVEVLIISEFSNCQAPDGRLRAVANGGAPDADFDFQWYEGLDIFTSPVIGINALATNLQPTTYTVLVTEKASGCQAIRSATVPTNASFPVVTATKLADVTDCVTPNGEASAAVTGQGIFWLEDFEDLGNGTGDDPNPPTMWSRSPTPGGGRWAEVRNINGSQQFEFNPDNNTPVTWTSEVIDITTLTNVNVDVDLNAQGSMETSGGAVDSLSAYIRIDGGPEIALDSGQHLGNFGSIKATARNLTGSTIQVVIRARTSAANERYQFDNVTISGVGSFTNGYTFNWYDGAAIKPGADFTGANYAGLGGGQYTVTATSDATGCVSDPVTITIDDLTASPVVTAVLDSDNTSCDPASANGAASANVSGATAGFTFRWFNGQNTLPANEVTGSPIVSLTGLAAGIYTVQATEDATGCTGIAEVTIADTPPIIVANPNPSDVTNCSPLNGALDASPTGGSAPYTQLWFNGNQGSPDLTAPDFTGPQTGFDIGDYTLVVRDANGCTSPAELVTIADNTTPPVLNLNSSDNTSCDPASPNGVLSARADIGGSFTTDPSLFRFDWYIGQNTINPAPGSPAAQISGVSAGIYTVVLTDLTTGCTDTLESTILNNIVDPVVSASVVSDQTICTPGSFDGEVTANVGGVTAGFLFYWFDGDIGAPDTTVADFQGPTYTAIPAGDYTVVTVNMATRCVSAREVVTVNDATVPPVISAIAIDNTSCDLTNPNGQLSADVSGTTTGFDFEWFAGQNTLPANSIGNTAVINGQAAGIYTVLVTNQATGCFDTEEVTINNNLVLPAVTANLVSDQSNCGVGILDGAVSADVAGSTTGFTFYWYDGSVGSPDTTMADFEGSSYTGLMAGTYTVVARNNASACLSLPQEVTVGNSTNPPTITTAINDNTSCDPANPNGTASADIGGNTAGFDWEWFTGQNTLPANSIATTPSVSNLAPGVYTVLATNQTSGCFSTAEVTIGDIPIDPVVAAALDSDQGNCGAGILDGQVSANVGGATAGFTFYWYDGNIGAPDTTMADFQGAVYSGLASGDYTVVARDNSTACLSDPQLITVNDNTVPPVITTGFVNNTSCVVGNPNGEVSANIAGGTAGFDFEWFSGQNTNPANSVGNTPTLGGLSSGIYTVLVTNQTTQCFATAEVNVNDNQISPTVTATLTRDQSACAAPATADGEVTADVGGVTAGFTFYWYDGNVGVPDTTMADFTGATYSSLVAGDYTVVARNNATGCFSAPDFVTVGNNTNPPMINAVATPNTSCDALNPNGTLSADVGGSTAGYNFEWFVGQNTLPANSIATTAGVINRGAGTYTVLVTDQLSGCFNTAEVTIINTPTVIVPTTASVDQTNCNPVNGSLSADVGGATAGFNFLWFNGIQASPDLSSPDLTGATVNNQPAGDYTLVVTNAFGCESTPVTVTINDATVLPVVTTSSTPQTACDPALANGTVSALADGGTAGYTFEWFNGQNTNPANSIGLGDTQIGLAAGTYTVLATNTTTGCQETAEATVIDNITPPTIASAPTTQNTTCGVFDGTITMNMSVGNALTDYLFELFAGSSATGPVLATLTNSGNIFSGLDAGTYTVRAFNTVLGCAVASTTTVTVNQDPATAITVNAAVINLPTSCADGTGVLEATASSPGNTGGFIFEWWTGSVATNDLAFLSNGIDQNAPPTINRLTNRNSGTYSVIARDNDTGCQDTTVIFLPFVDEHTVTLAGQSQQTNCGAPNGEIQLDINIPLATGTLFPGVNPSWYRVDVFRDNLPFTTVFGTDPNPTIISGLEAGTYTITATEDNPGFGGSSCPSQPLEVIILDNTINPGIAETVTANSSCDVGLSNGEILLDIDGGAPLGNYNYAWFRGIDNSNPIAPTGGAAGNPIGLDSGFYFVEVENIATGCTDSKAIYVPLIRPTLAVSNVSVVASNNCAPFNGEASVDDIFENGISSGANFTNYRFNWFDASQNSINVIPGTPQDRDTTDLAPGIYFVSGIDINTNCETSLVQFEIQDTSSPPTVALISSIPNTFCDPVNGDGSIIIEIAGGTGNTGNHIINWYEGTTATPGNELGTTVASAASADSLTITGLIAGSYTVRIVDKITNLNCETTATFRVLNNPPVVGIDDVAVTPNQNCSPSDGTATVTDILINGATSGPAFADFRFNWYDATQTLIGLGLQDEDTTGLDPGIYYVEGISLVSGCNTSLVEFEILDDAVNPLIALAGSAPNINCAGATPTGSLTIEVDGAAPTALNHNIEWATDPSFAPAFILPPANVTGAAGETAQDLAAGTYYVRVTNINAALPNQTCFAVASFEVIDDLPTISIEPVAVTPNTNCNPGNGTATVTDLRIDGGAVIGVPANYRFNWYDNTQTLIGLGLQDADTTDLEPGIYFVSAFNLTSQCESDLRQFEILDEPVLPFVQLVTSTANTTCDPLNPDGQLVIQIDGGVGSLGTHDIQWYTGAVATPGNELAGPPANSLDSLTIDGLAPGQYTVRVRTLGPPGQSCEAVATFSVGDNPPAVTIAGVTPTPNTNCSPGNGAASVDNVAEDGVNQPIANYRFNWYDNTQTLLGAGLQDRDTTDLTPGTYFVEAVNINTLCQTGLVQFEILDEPVPPFLQLLTSANNTTCDPLNPDGQLVIQIDAGAGSLATHDIQWYTGASATPGNELSGLPASSLDSLTIDGLAPGQYTVRVRDLTDPGQSCETIATFSIDDNPPVVAITGVTPTPNNNCSPGNGAAFVDNVVENGINQAIANYRFNWYDNTQTLLGAGLQDRDTTDLEPGTYFVEAVNINTLCQTGLVQFEILDESTPPVISLDNFQPNTICVGTPNGLITLGVGGAAPPIGQYTVEWFEDATLLTPLGTNFGLVAGANNETAQNLPSGTVYARVTDILSPDQSCASVVNFTMVDSPPVVTIAGITPSANTNCSPGNGAASVDNVSENGVNQAISDYRFNWYDNTQTLLGAGLQDRDTTDLVPGVYFVEAVNINTFCQTGLVQFEIEDTSTPPLVTGVIAPDVTCGVPAVPTGSIILTVNGSTTPLPGGEYQVDWFEDQALTIPLAVGSINADGSQVTQLPGGTYFVRVTDLLSPDQNCFVVSSFDVPTDRPVLSIAQSDVVVTPNSNCSGFNGTATVNFILEDGMQMPPANYTFEWLDSTFTPIPGFAGNSITGLSAGTYFVRATNNVSNCSIVPPFEFIIEDITAAPVIQLLSFAEPTRCDGLNNLGNLRVQADGSVSTVDYNFEWHQGDASGPIFEPNNFEVINLAAGDYTVVVRNNTTGCISEETFTLDVVVTDLLVTVSSSPWTSCITDDGSVFAAVTNTDATYDFEWYTGIDATGTPDFTSNPVPGLTEGDFTVIATDRNDPFCVSQPATVRVEDLRIFPEIIPSQDAALTNCDPTNPNGQVSASTLLGVTGFTFEWYEGTAVSGTPFSTGAIATMLDAGPYTVQVTDVISGCASDTTVVVGDSTFLSIPPPPNITVLSQMTSCISPNGALEADVNGQTRGFEFNWYNGSTAGTTPDFTGPRYVDLDVGPYAVTANDPLTGCVSPPADTVIIDQTIIPEFGVIVQNATCNEPTGFVVVEFIPGFEYTGVQWTLEDGTVIDAPGLFDIPVGTYDVTVFGAGGCENDTTVEVGTDIRIYNGVSPNGDGSNDVFIVECLEEFENNNVKIFNRAGQLVYETDNYNNADISFDGRGNRGIYIDSNNVPDGTYFYVVDKRDGSEPRSGYLELIR